MKITYHKHNPCLTLSKAPFFQSQKFQYSEKSKYRYYSQNQLAIMKSAHKRQLQVIIKTSLQLSLHQFSVVRDIEARKLQQKRRKVKKPQKVENNLNKIEIHRNILQDDIAVLQSTIDTNQERVNMIPTFNYQDSSILLTDNDLSFSSQNSSNANSEFSCVGILNQCQERSKESLDFQQIFSKIKISEYLERQLQKKQMT